ncbi:ComEC/Rec2 family competence protein [Pseudarthrobacter sp. AB1]|uniref:ComEC/Rec2 family competence protein n=1 Tax=Pseudarthrobacter sp. AB1 TaxID=2138309 RepID=UPI00186B75ED|nr:ComEC/Rec2 family competence protein [Pseudarthrobacter sp. AB1]MBE4720140.1 hypothetical protein [Pseudarthrobacter sp. AB1]
MPSALQCRYDTQRCVFAQPTLYTTTLLHPWSPGRGDCGNYLLRRCQEAHGREPPHRNPVRACRKQGVRSVVPTFESPHLTAALARSLIEHDHGFHPSPFKAVSGANCSLVLGALLIAARSLRLPRLPAAGLALTGLAMFVVLVGPDASVLRAALMGSIAVASLAGGRTGRGLSFLCLAVMGLLLIDPGLGTSFGFLLSVLATLGIIVLGRRMIDWTPAVIPRWAAAAWAVPLSAQLLCGPVIVLLQPQFSTYSLLANLMAAPLVAPVTLLGTAAVPLVVAAPWLATVLIAVAWTFSAGVAGTARITAGLPGAALPWPEGPFGLLTMVLFSVLTLGILWLAVRPRQVFRWVLALHARTESVLDLLERRLGAAVCQRPDRRGPGRRGPNHRAPGLVAAAHRGRLRHCTRISGRNPPWPQPRPLEPGLRRPTRPPGGT